MTAQQKSAHSNSSLPLDTHATASATADSDSTS